MNIQIEPELEKIIQAQIATGSPDFSQDEKIIDKKPERVEFI
ncbi:MAG: hypothetical protein ACKPEO_24880 [Sphaerospermopsis kisseleviana]